ncbi:MAG: hypothetical protein K0Q66_1577, partial [Chitinophagaceae bacterium]|nr:hypothetical protein [Chitinophagaceae bacterium]
SAYLYLRIIANRYKSSPLLIEKLNDTNSTNIKSPCKTTRLNVAEVSYAALDEISSLPIFLITRIQFDVIHNECWNFYDYFYNNKNKKEFQRMVRDWYSKEKNNYKPKTISKKKQTDCQRKYKITKYWDWKR